MFINAFLIMLLVLNIFVLSRSLTRVDGKAIAMGLVAGWIVSFALLSRLF